MLPTIPAASIDAVITDLPYGTTANKWDAVVPLIPMWAELLRVTKDSAALVFTASQPFSAVLVASQLSLFRHEWIWWKDKGSNFMNCKREPMKEHESALVFSRGKWTYNQQKQQRTGNGLNLIGTEQRGGKPSENYNETRRYKFTTSELRVPSSVQKFNRQVGMHPTQKPTELMRYLVRTYTNPGDTVLDITMGSGTTGVAALLEGRKFVGIERDPEYFALAIARMIDRA